MRDIPRLSWLGGKTMPQQNGGRKNEPGRMVEHAAALITKAIAETSPDLIDTCLVCGKEIPPGPDFCSVECEEKVKKAGRESDAYDAYWHEEHSDEPV